VIEILLGQHRRIRELIADIDSGTSAPSRELLLYLTVIIQSGESQNPAHKWAGEADNGPLAMRQELPRAGNQPGGSTVDETDPGHVEDQPPRLVLQDRSQMRYKRRRGNEVELAADNDRDHLGGDVYIDHQRFCSPADLKLPFRGARELGRLPGRYRSVPGRCRLRSEGVAQHEAGAPRRNSTGVTTRGDLPSRARHAGNRRVRPQIGHQ
jgi:hypothetical protein